MLLPNNETAGIDPKKLANYVLNYRMDMDIVRGYRCAKVRAGWLCQAEATRLVTCYVIGECDEIA